MNSILQTRPDEEKGEMGGKNEAGTADDILAKRKEKKKEQKRETRKALSDDQRQKVRERDARRKREARAIAKEVAEVDEENKRLCLIASQNRERIRAMSLEQQSTNREKARKGMRRFRAKMNKLKLDDFHAWNKIIRRQPRQEPKDDKRTTKGRGELSYKARLTKEKWQERGIVYSGLEWSTGGSA